jgi:DNA-binding protein YbaB
MPFTPLPPASSFAAALLTIENQLAGLEARLAGITFPAASADNKVSVVVNANIEVTAVTIDEGLFTGTNPIALPALATTLVTVTNQALAAAHTRAISETATTAAGFNLQGVCAPNAAMPTYAGFPEAAAALIAEEPAIDQRVAARQFTGQVGVATAVVNGRLDVVSLSLAGLPDHLPVLATDVAAAINRALDGAKRLVDDTVGGVVDTIATNTVQLTGLCLYARDTMAIGDRVKVLGQTAGTFAPIANAGSAQTNIGADAQTGNVWSRAPVTLRDRAQVTGFVNTASTVTRQSQTVVTGPITENGFIQLPSFGFSVTFPGTNSGDVTVAPNTSTTLAPGAFRNLIVNGGATLFLSKGTYFFDGFDIESNATISCSSTTGQVVVYARGAIIFRGKIIEKTGGRPKFFLGAFGTGAIPVGGPFTGTLAAPEAQITLNNVAAPGHSGAFFGKSIQVDPDGAVTWFPFSGTPSLGTF